jgi:hypothetical protein
MFSNVYKEVTCHECHIFEGKRNILSSSKRNLLSLPLRPILVEAPFEKWGLDFIGEMNPSSSGQYKWILTTIDYFTKWIEKIPTRQAIATIIQCVDNNILSRFGFPRRIITNNAQAFKSKKMVKFCDYYHIIIIDSTAY